MRPDPGTVVPSEETRARVEGAGHFVRWIEPRLAGDPGEREAAMVMMLAQMQARYAEGIHDAAELLRTLSQGKPASRDLAVAANALAELKRRTRLDPPVAL